MNGVLQKLVPLGLLLFCVVLTGCSTIQLPEDFKWRTVYAVQIPDRQVFLDLKTVDRCKVDCRCRTSNAELGVTEIRLLRLKPFQNLENLPELNNPPGVANGGVPADFIDFGPQDMTLIGSRRLVAVSTGSQLLVRSKGKCIGLRVRKITNPKTQN